MAGVTSTRLDMKHGFMKSIIRNQVDRDNYDKEIKASKGYEKPSKNKSKKPDVNVYIPPMRQKKDEKDEMFCLEFEDKDGMLYTFPVYKSDKASLVARRLGTERQLPSHLVSALELRLQQEMNARLEVETQNT